MRAGCTVVGVADVRTLQLLSYCPSTIPHVTCLASASSWSHNHPCGAGYENATSPANPFPPSQINGVLTKSYMNPGLLLGMQPVIYFYKSLIPGRRSGFAMHCPCVQSASLVLGEINTVHLTDP